MKKRLKHPHPVLRIIRLAAGILLLVLGIIGGLLPIIQGWIFVLPALALLAPESRFIRKLIIRLRTKLRLRRLRKRRSPTPAGAAGKEEN